MEIGKVEIEEEDWDEETRDRIRTQTELKVGYYLCVFCNLYVL